MFRRERTALVLAILALGAVLAACGSSDNGVASKSATAILAAAKTAAQSASAVHVSANVSAGRAKLAMSASLAKTQGHTQLKALGSALEVIHTGETIYIKGNRAFNARLGNRLGVKIPSGTWLKGPANGTMARFAPLASIVRELGTILTPHSPLTKGARTKIDGQPAIELKETTKSNTATLYIATTGPPYPILLRRSGRETGQTTFTDWNDPVRISAPAGAVELSQLQPRKKR
jgi:hypothetical protein